MFICPTFEIYECTEEYQSGVKHNLGQQAIQDKKTEIFKNKLIAIGWELDLERWGGGFAGRRRKGQWWLDCIVFSLHTGDKDGKRVRLLRTVEPV
jgi:hypothetical protein